MFATIKYISKAIAIAALAAASVVAVASISASTAHAQGLISMPKDNYFNTQLVKDVAGFCPAWTNTFSGTGTVEAARNVISGYAKYGVESDAGLLALVAPKDSDYNKVRPIFQIAETSLILIARNYALVQRPILTKMSQLTPSTRVITTDSTSNSTFRAFLSATNLDADIRTTDIMKAFELLHSGVADVVAVSSTDPAAMLMVSIDIDGKTISQSTRTLEWDGSNSERVNKLFTPKSIISRHAATNGINSMASNLVLYSTTASVEAREFASEMFDCYARNIEKIRTRAPMNAVSWSTSNVLAPMKYIGVTK